MIQVGGMANANRINTPNTGEPVGAELERPAFDEELEYSQFLLIYLAANKWIEIAYVVQQAARFPHNPKTVMLCNRAYIMLSKGTQDNGVYMRPDGLKVVLLCQFRFWGLFGSEDSSNPVSVKSRPGYLINIGNFPIMWVSKLRSQIALSTMEAELAWYSTSGDN